MGEYGDVSDEVREYNRRLVERYPWLLPRNVWTDQPLEDYDYEFTNFDDIPDGWRKAFGLNMMEDIRKELIKVNYLEDFRVLQCKEKYGELRYYISGVPKECKVGDIIYAYEAISRNICICCGKLDVPMVNASWISPYCRKCWDDGNKRYLERYSQQEDEDFRRKYLEANDYDRLTSDESEQIPTMLYWRSYSNDKQKWTRHQQSLKKIVSRIRKGEQPEI